MTAACAVTAPVVVPAGVVVAVASTAAIAQQPANDKPNPPSTLPPLPPSALPAAPAAPASAPAAVDTTKSRAAAALSRAPGLLPPGPTGASGAATPAPATQPAIAPNPTRDQAASLAAAAKLALQRGDLAAAKSLVDQANALKVPDNQFGPGQLKPWDVTMDIERAIRLRGNTGVTTAAAVTPATTTTGTNGNLTDKNAAVQPGVFQPGTDMSKVAPASSNLTLGALASQDSTANEWYEKGLEAMSLGDRDTALQNFSNAWKKKEDLDPAIRAQLKDKLTYLQSRSTPEPVSAIPNENREAIQKKQRLFAEVSGEIADAERLVNEKPYESLDRLKALRSRVSQADVDGAYRKQMLAMVDRVVSNVEGWMEQNRASIELDQRNRQIEDRISLEAANSAKEDAQIQTLVDEYNELMENARYAEAEVIARKVERSSRTPK